MKGFSGVSLTGVLKLTAATVALVSAVGMVFLADVPELPSHAVYAGPGGGGITEEMIRARIDEAVKKALEDADSRIERRLKSSVDANMSRLSVIDSLPDSADRRETPLKSDRTELAVKTADSFKESEKRKIYTKKLSYNTKTAEGDRALKAGNYRSAAEFYRAALELKDSPVTLAKLFRADLRSGSIEEFKNDLRRYGALADEKIIAGAAKDTAAAGYLPEAVELLRGYKETFADRGLYHYTLGQLNELEGDYVAAELSYREAVKAYPDDAYYLYACARNLDLQSRYEEAAEIYSRVAGMTADSELTGNSKARAADLNAYLETISGAGK